MEYSDRSALGRKYPEIIHRLESLGMMPERIPTLGPIRSALQALGLLEKINPQRVIVVAGTNGKGTTCATLEALLRATGARVGLYVSPHLERTTERIRVDGEEMTEERFVELFERIRGVVEQFGLSHFEVLTLMAVYEFFSGAFVKAVDWAILEVGLGGLWDATNAVPHCTSVITRLGFDHQQYLGDSLPEIALNKFGIVTALGKVIHVPFSSEVFQVADAIQSVTQSVWRECEPFETIVPTPGGKMEFSAETRWGNVRLALLGRRAAENTVLALTAFEELGFDPKEFLSAVEQVKWPGRMEERKLPGIECPVYFSGDHNPQGAESLLEILNHFGGRHVHLLVAMTRDKDHDAMLRVFSSLDHRSIYLTQTPVRTRTIEEYGPWLDRVQGAWHDPLMAIKKIGERAGPRDLVVVTGSLYLVGQLRSLAR